MGYPRHARYAAAGFRRKMRNTLPINENRVNQHGENLGIGILFIGISIFFIVLMIAWLLYNIFIFSKG